jgi:large subunit ribosomal protein L34e
MAARVHYTRKHTYRTRSNLVRKFRTPGGKLAIQYRNKRVARILCGDTKQELNGIPRTIKSVFKNLPKRRRTVTRAYGGSLSHEAVRHRVLRAFFNEELKVIKQGASAQRRVKKQAGKGRKK